MLTAEVEQLVPVRTVSCQSRGVEGKQNADGIECDLRDEMLKALTLVDGCAATSKVGIDHVRVLFIPTERDSPLTQRVLHALTFFVGDDLVGARLSYIDHRLAVEVSRLDQFGSVHRSFPSWFGGTVLRLVARRLVRARTRLAWLDRGLLSALLVLLHEVQELLYSQLAQFGFWRVTNQG
jgi:hypothetical protein